MSTSATTSSVKIPTKLKQNSGTKVSFPPPSLGAGVTLPVNVHRENNTNVATSSPNGQCDGETVSQSVENSDVESENCSSDKVATKELPVDLQLDPERLRAEGNLSFEVPDGLVMDPHMPTTLAVPTNLMDRIGSGLTLLKDHGKKVQKYIWKNRKCDILKKSWKSIVNVVLIEAKDLPEEPNYSGFYCKIKLGNESHKSKQASKSKPSWCERFNLYLYEDSSLEVAVWHKAKQKNFVGRCVVDLSALEKEKTNDVWQELESGRGAVHMLVTLSAGTRSAPADNVPTTNGVHHPPPATDEFSWYRLAGMNEVGKLSVTVYGARGLSPLGLNGKADAYCVLELDNSRVQTHTVKGSSDPMWNKSYTFDVNDITSTLDIKVLDESIIGETLGKISIPLLRINNDEKKWYALKDRSKKSSAKGNCPRILLQMSVAWNPIKASLRVLSPKETKYTQKPNTTKFNIPLIYNDLKFIGDIFNVVYIGNEHFKYVFEWENREKSTVALIAWLTFWLFFRMWMTPLLVLIPFIHYWMGHRNYSNSTLMPTCQSEDDSSDDDLESKDEKTIVTRLYGLQDLTITIKDGIDYIVSLIERVKNLLNFTVPYLSYLAMAAMVALSAALYLLPINYLFMAFGIYKFTRKYLNPDRVPNNDILDFISRVPDDKILKQWQELKVPEPSLSRTELSEMR